MVSLPTLAAHPSPAEQLRALVEGCGFHAAKGWVRFAVRGSDRVRWLNGMVTNNIRDLAAGRGCYAFLLSPQGKIQGDLYVFNAGDALTVETDAAQVEKIRGIFDRYIIMDDVELGETVEVPTLAVSGPSSSEQLQKVGIPAPTEALAPQKVEWHGNPTQVTRWDWPGSNYRISCTAEMEEKLRRELQDAGAVEVDAAAFEHFRIAQGVPAYQSDIGEKYLPQETAQERALNFSKGCYVGQEIVERIRSRGAVHRQLTRLEFRGGLPPAGEKLQFEGKEVGEVTSVAAQMDSSSAFSGIGLGYVRREVPREAVLNHPGGEASIRPNQA